MRRMALRGFVAVGAPKVGAGMRVVAVTLESWDAELERVVSWRVGYVRADGWTLTTVRDLAGRFAVADAALLAERHGGVVMVPA